nr:immunoglobulin light chain junction region [Macaca mulatta]
CQQYNSLPYNF